MSDVENESDVSKILEGVDVTSHECIRIMSDACRKGRKDIVTFLLNKGFDLKEHYSPADPLLGACAFGHIEIAKLLLENGLEINACESAFCQNALHYACGNTQNRMVEFLLENGIDFEAAADSGGGTPLDYALRDEVEFSEENSDIILSLLELGSTHSCYTSSAVKDWHFAVVLDRINEIKFISKTIFEKCPGRIAQLIVEFSFAEKIKNLEIFLEFDPEI
jgi:ankyrin repeat protein